MSTWSRRHKETAAKRRWRQTFYNQRNMKRLRTRATVAATTGPGKPEELPGPAPSDDFRSDEQEGT